MDPLSVIGIFAGLEQHTAQFLSDIGSLPSEGYYDVLSWIKSDVNMINDQMHELGLNIRDAPFFLSLKFLQNLNDVCIGIRTTLERVDASQIKDKHLNAHQKRALWIRNGSNLQKHENALRQYAAELRLLTLLSMKDKEEQRKLADLAIASPEDQKEAEEAIYVYQRSLTARQIQCWRRVKFTAGSNQCLELPQSRVLRRDQKQNLRERKVPINVYIQAENLHLPTFIQNYKSLSPTASVQRVGYSLGNMENLSAVEIHCSLQSMVGLDLVLSNSLGQGSDAISLSKQSFAEIMTTLNLSNDFLIAMLAGTPTFQQIGKQTSADDSISFVMRMPLAGQNNWALALTWDPTKRLTSGLLHGAAQNEIEDLCYALSEFHFSIMHPLLVPVLLCELLTVSDSNEIKRHAANLYKVEMQTSSLGVGKADLTTVLTDSPTPEDNFEDLTRSLNVITSRLAFHEMRVNANVTLVATLLLNLINIQLVHYHKSSRVRPFTKDSEEMYKHIDLLQQRLKNLQVEHAALLNEITCNLKIASGQLQIIFSLITQRDGRESLRVAAIGTSIAAMTKDDSFAMRTIAIMTVIFLPSTLVATMFSTGMFSWQAKGDDAVVSSRFWIFWVVSIPLTLAVLATWLAWIHAHQKKERKAAPEFYLPLLRKLEGSRLSRFAKKLVPGVASRVKAKLKDVEDVEIQSDAQNGGEEQKPARLAKASASRTLEEKANAFVQGPLR